MSLARGVVRRYVWRVPPPSSSSSSSSTAAVAADKQATRGAADGTAARTFFKWGVVSQRAGVSLYDGANVHVPRMGKARTRNCTSLQPGLPGGFAREPGGPRQLPK